MQFARETSKMWSGSCSAEPTARSLLAGPAEDLTPWWELDSRLSEYTRARPRRATSAVASRCVDGRWVLEGPAPAWFRGAQDLLQGTPLAPADAFEVQNSDCVPKGLLLHAISPPSRLPRHT